MLFIKFHGAGWMFPFYFGVAKFLREHVDLTREDVRVGGASAGAVTALMLLLDTDFDRVFKKVVRRYDAMRYNPFTIKQTLHDILLEYIPEDPEKLEQMQGKFRVGLSKLDFRKLAWRSKVEAGRASKEKCIDLIKASCHIPLISGVFPYYVDGEGYYDGEITGFEPEPSDAVSRLVAVSVRPGADVVPNVDVPRIWQYYPAAPVVLRAILNLGYQQAHRYFSANAESLSRYLKKPVRAFTEDTIYKEVVEYSLQKTEVCSVRRPLYTIFHLIPFKGAWLLLALLWFRRRIADFIRRLL